MDTRSSIGGMFLFLAAALATDSRASTPKLTPNSLLTAIDDAVKSKGLPSVVVVLFDDHDILWSHTAGHADVATKRPPTLTTRYRLGSMAKAATSTVVAIAARKQLISFQTRVPVKTAAGSLSVSIEQAVNMQAGLAQAICYQGITGRPDPSCESGFDRDFSIAMTDGKGRYSYSNMGPQIAADGLAKMLREPFDDIARRLLFEPAGMADATYDHLRPSSDRATAYDPVGKPYSHDFRIMPRAGAGFEASARDLVRFGQLHLTGLAPDGRRLLSTRTLAVLHSAPNGGFYGYGWGRIGGGKSTEVLIADGQVNGGQATLILSPQHRRGAIVLSNAAHDEVSALAITAIDAVAPGTAAAFAADLRSMQSAHEAESRAYFPPGDFDASGFVRVQETRIPVKLASRANRLSITIAGQTSELTESSIDEGFRVWPLSCPRQIPPCGLPGATAKIFLSRDSDGLGGQIQVTSMNGQVPFGLRVELH